jgi:DNA invertase Pin-like site-specific DNA recombinase
MGLDRKIKINDLRMKITILIIYKEKSYNVFIVQPIIICPFLAQGKRFESVHEAVRNLNISRSTLRRYLKDPLKTDYFYLVGEESSYGKIPFFAKKQDTSSLLF